MIALILIFVIIIGVCFIISSLFHMLAGIALFSWWMFGLFWFFYTWTTKGKTGSDTLFDKIAIGPLLPIAALFGWLNEICQEKLGLP